MESHHENAPEGEVRAERNLAPRFLALMLVYLCAVYACSLYVYPLGRDYQHLARPDTMPWLAARFFTAEVHVFGTFLPAYHVLNLVLLYVCMLALFFLTRYAVRGPWWLGSLTAVMLMANPVKSEAVLNLSGAVDLLPACFALVALAFYGAHVQGLEKRGQSRLARGLARLVQSPFFSAHKFVVPASAGPDGKSGDSPVSLGDSLAWYSPPFSRTSAGAIKLVLSLLFFSVGVLFFPVNVALVLVVVLYEKFIATPDERRWGRVIPFVIVGLVGLYLHRGVLTAASLDPAGMFSPLLLIFYPIGLLPETAGCFHVYPVLGWLSALVIAGILALVYRKVRHPVADSRGRLSHTSLLFGLSGALAVRLFQGAHEIDLVHMVGGGQLLLGIALLNIAFAAVCLRVMQHPKWHRPVVFVTTLLCLVLLALQVRANLAWRCAGREVQAFQRAARQASALHPGALLGVLPDFQYYRGAPMMLSESIRYETIFSPALPAFSILPIHLDAARRLEVEVRSWSATEAEVRIAVRPLDVLCSPYVLPEPSGAVETEHVVVHWEEVQDDSAIVRIRPKRGTLPASCIPFIK